MSKKILSSFKILRKINSIKTQKENLFILKCIVEKFVKIATKIYDQYFQKDIVLSSLKKFHLRAKVEWYYYINNQSEAQGHCLI